MISFWRKFNREIVSLVLSVLGCSCRLKHIIRAPDLRYTDEIFQIRVIERASSLWALIKALPQSSHAAYLDGDFLLLYPFVKIFGPHRWGIVIPHMIMVLIFFYLLHLTCKQYCRTVWGHSIAFIIVCFNHTLIHYSVELRPYIVLPTLSFLAFCLARKLFSESFRLSLRQRLIFSLCFVLVLLFHIHGVVILSCVVLFFFLDALRTSSFKFLSKGLVKFFFPVILIVAPVWCLSVFGPSWEYLPRYPFDFLPNPAVDSIGFLKSVFGNLIGYRNFYLFLPGIFIPFVLPYKDRFMHILFLLILIFLPIVIIFSAMVHKEYWFLQRQLIWVMPFFALFLGQSWDALICYLGDQKTKNHPVCL